MLTLPWPTGARFTDPIFVSEILDADDNVVKVIEPEVIGQLELNSQYIELIRAGLRGVIDLDNGTANSTFDVPGIDASGKTGTAEFCEEYPQCLDRDGRVRTSHAWFASYAPTNNPEIVTIVFVYGGDEGSQVAVPVTNKILRHYFGIEDAPDETEADSADDEEQIVTNVPDVAFAVRLLGTDSWSQEGANVSGFILDADEQGLAEVTIEILANGEVVDQITSGPVGQFNYSALDPAESKTWQLRLPDYPETPYLRLEIAAGLRYLVEFKAQPVIADSPDELNN